MLRCRVPGALASSVIDDAVTGDRIEIVIAPLSTTIRVNEREYHFDRFTGHHTGSGTRLP